MLAIIVGVVLPFMLGLSVFGFLVLRRRWRFKDSRSIHNTTKSTKTLVSAIELQPYLCRYFPLDDIKTATQNFKDTFTIGVGGFGNVYKGYIDGGATMVAIKRLNPSLHRVPMSSRRKLKCSPNSGTAI
ncbi:hypothetical protein M0R45_007480 [Rubus argutus]|uniref:Uncharacterized protein n=1 Tax=Rubus argutus TaxID=59490 RepID=A0AAW1XZY0_RUBAR